MGWILFKDDNDENRAWPDASTRVEVKNDRVILRCGKAECTLHESPSYTRDFDQVLLFIEAFDDEEEEE